MRAWADKKFTLTEHADAFVAWFGDSKVVNDAGEPLVVHKGMPKKNWQTGEDIKEIQSPNGPWAGFFSDSQSVADRFAKAYSFTTGGSHVVSGYAKIEKPYIIDAKGGAAKTVQFDTLVDVKGVGLRVKVEPKIEAIIKSGKYDGIIVKNTSDEGTIYVPFKSAQVKSTSNSGAFSKDEAHIEKSLALKFNPNHDSLGRFASGGGGGAKKKATGGIESETTKEILSGIQKDSADSAEESLANFAGEFEFWAQRYSGEGDFKHTAAEAKEKFDAAMEKADYVIVFDAHKPIGDPESEATPSLQEVLGSDPSPRIKNRFEANTTTVEQPDSHRLSYERGTFGDAMDKVPIGDKPKYGTIRFEGDHQSGMCSHYGTSAIVLNKEAIKSRTTITPYDTSENGGLNDAFKKEQGIGGLVSSAEHPYEALANNPHAIQRAGYPRQFVEYMTDKGIISGGSGNLRNEANDYIEAQVFGSLPMNSSVVKKIVVYDGTAGTNWYRERANENNKFNGSSEPDLPMLTREEHYAPMIALSKRTGIPIEFVED